MEISQSHLKWLRENPIYINGIIAKKKELGIYVEESEELIEEDITSEFDELMNEEM